MKSLLKIYSKYIITACIIILLLITANIVIYFYLVIYNLTQNNKQGIVITRHKIDQIASTMLYENTEKGYIPYIPDEGIEIMEQNDYIFAMIISPQGDVVWQWQCPEELPMHYTAGDIASFSKWYLKGYPVKGWRVDDYLVLCGNEKNFSWKYSVEVPLKFMENLGYYAGINLLINLSIIFCIILIIGYRFYKSLRPITKSIEELAEGKTIQLPEKGVISELNRKLNQTSLILESQQQALDKRDNARTEWIASVSHDIRTPLSMIIGYADGLSANEGLTEEQRRQAQIIMSQSTKIKTLIEDLNLTSKLEYHMQPLNIEHFMFAPFLREIVVSYLNGGIKEEFTISLTIETDVESTLMNGDKKLLTRAINNLINNCMQHNQGGCHIELAASLLNAKVCSFTIKDNGKGIPAIIVDSLNGQVIVKVPHIMGLRISKQIIDAHQGNFYISSDKHTVVMELPLI